MATIRDRLIVVRLTEGEAARLQAHAVQTHRTVSQVVRLLLSRAEVAAQPDIHLAARQEPDR